MTPEELLKRIPESEFQVFTSRSSGPGGQNVNKVNTKVEIHFNVKLSSGLSVPEKDMICMNLKNKINTSGEIVVKSQSERTQLGNRKKALEKLLVIISDGLAVKSERKPTFPSKKSKTERLEEKKKRGQTKRLRSGDITDYDDN